MLSFLILMSNHFSIIGSHDVVIQSKAPGVAESLTTTCIPYGFVCNDGKPCCASKPCAYGVCGGADAIAMDCAILLVVCVCCLYLGMVALLDIGTGDEMSMDLGITVGDDPEIATGIDNFWASLPAAAL